MCAFVCASRVPNTHSRALLGCPAGRASPSSFSRWAGILRRAELVLAGSSCTAEQQLGMQSRQMCPEDIPALQHIW